MRKIVQIILDRGDDLRYALCDDGTVLVREWVKGVWMVDEAPVPQPEPSASQMTPEAPKREWSQKAVQAAVSAYFARHGATSAAMRAALEAADAVREVGE